MPGRERKAPADKSIREVRAALADVVNDAVAGRITYITSHGRRVAAVVPLAVADDVLAAEDAAEQEP